MRIPNRIKKHSGRHSLVDGIPFTMPVKTINAQVLAAGFYCDYKRAASLLPGIQLHPLRLWNGKAIFTVTVVNYLRTTFGKCIEYRLALAVTRGAHRAPPFLPILFTHTYHTGQFLLDLPVSTEISVKGGKGIWGMPKHQASLDFVLGEKDISAQYEDNGVFAFRIEIERPSSTRFPLNMSSTWYGQFRNMLFASSIYLSSRAGFRYGRRARGSLYIGDKTPISYLRDLGLESKPFFTLYMPDTTGILDDHVQSWFITYQDPPEDQNAGLESVTGLGLGDTWPPPPTYKDYDRFKI